MKLPKDVLIGAQTYRIIERSETDDGMLGQSYAYTLIESKDLVQALG